VGVYLAVTINIHAYPWVAAAAFNLYLALFVYYKNPAAVINRVFVLLSAAIAVWCLNAFELYLVPDAAWAARLSRFFVLGTFFVPPLFLHFVLHLAHTTRHWWPRRMLFAAYAVSLLFCGVDLAGLFVHGYIRVGWKFVPRSEPLYILWMLNAAFWMTAALVHVFRRYRRATASKVRAQLRYFLLASFIGTVFAFENFLVSMGIPVYPLGGIFTSVYLAIVAYSIVQHQLMDITVIVRRSIIYATLTLSVAGIYAGVVGAITALIGSRHWVSHAWIVNGLAGAIVAGVFLPLRNRIQHAVDRVFFKEKYNYRMTLKAFSEHLTSILEADLLSETLVARVLGTMHVGRGCMFVFDGERDEYRMSYSRGMGHALHHEITLSCDHPLVRWLEEYKRVFVADEAQEVSRGLAAQGIVISVPLVIRGKLIGMLNLGEKLSEDMYTDEDLELLTTLANHAAIALENAGLAARMRLLEKSLYHTDKLTALGTFAYSVAHEIKNPLASIKTFCQLVSRKFDDAKFVDKFNTVVPAEIMRLENVLGQLLDFGKFSGTELSPVRIETVVDDLISLIHYDVFRKNIRIVRRYGDNVPAILGHEEQMKQVFMNLVLNAMQAMPDGGEICLMTGTTAEGKVIVRVADTGCGIPKESLGRLFKPFFTTKSDGTGLGLSITRKIIREHGGTIDVESVVNKGTTFTIQLPRQDASV
jgi:signal transduction histidine kinase